MSRIPSNVLVLAAVAALACGGDGPGTEPNTTITVSGIVRDRGGDPISGAAVVVAGRSSVTTDADGRFAILGVAAPYDLTVVVSSRHTALVYKGLTRPDPALTFLDFMGAQQTATISGTTPPAPGEVTFVFFHSGRNVAGGSPADPTTGQYAMTSTWQVSATTHAGQLHVLRWKNGPTGGPESYDGYASRPLTISAGGDFSGNDFVAGDLTDPPEQSIGGSVVVPSGYSLTRRRFHLFFERVPAYWDEPAPSSNAFTFTVPVVTGVAYGVAAWGEDPASRSSFFFKSGISGNSINVSIPLEAAAQLASPPDGATAVDATTPFRWTQGGGAGVTLFEAIPYASTNPTFLVFTTGTDAKLPDLAGAGMGLPATAAYRWFAERVFPVASIDEAAGAGFLRLLDLEAGDFGATASEGFDFTTTGTAGTALRGSPVVPTTGRLPERRATNRDAQISRFLDRPALAPAATRLLDGSTP